MKKTIAAFAVAAAASVGMLGLFAGSASAHTAPMSYDCFNVTVHFQDFATNPPGTGSNTATVTVDGAVTNVSFTTASHTTTVPLVSHSGDPAVVVTVAWHGLDGNTNPGTTQTFPTATCVAPASTTTTVAPTTTVPTNVSPAEVVRPAATVAAAVVVAPAFTG